MKKFIAEIGSADNDISLAGGPIATKTVLIAASDAFAAHKRAYVHECSQGQEVLSIKIEGTNTVVYTLKEGFKKA